MMGKMSKDKLAWAVIAFGLLFIVMDEKGYKINLEKKSK